MSSARRANRGPNVDQRDSLKLSPRRLSKSSKLQPKTDHDNGLEFWADLLAGLMAIACGISTGVAFLSLSFFTPTLPFYLLASIIGIAGIGINWYIFQQPVRDVLIDIFGKEKFFQGLFESKSSCELLSLNEAPTENNIFKLGIKSDAAYVLYNNELYYINKKRNEVENITQKIPLSQQEGALKKFKFLADVIEKSKTCRLNYADLQQITKITGHRHLPRYKKILIGFGLIVALSVGITFGALAGSQTLSLFAGIGFFSATTVLLPYIAVTVAAILTIATVLSMTALMLKDIADGIKTENAGYEAYKFIKNLLDFGTHTQIRRFETMPSKRDLQSLIETDYAYIKIDNQYYHYHKHDKNGLLQKIDVGNEQAMNSLFQTDKKKLSFKELAIIEQATGNGKIRTSRGWVIAERILTTILTALTIPLAVIGLLMTMNACAPGLKQLLLSFIPRAAATVVNFIAIGFAFFGQIPFTLQVTINTIKGFFEKEKAGKIAANEPAIEKIILLKVGAVINAIGNGLISLMGARASRLFYFISSGIGGFWNSFAAGFSSVNRSLNKEVSSSSLITKGLSVDDFNLSKESDQVSKLKASRVSFDDTQKVSEKDRLTFQEEIRLSQIQIAQNIAKSLPKKISKPSTDDSNINKKSASVSEQKVGKQVSLDDTAKVSKESLKAFQSELSLKYV